MEEEKIQKKICSNCEKEFPLTTEFFNIRRVSKDGFGYRCKKCNIEVMREYRVKNPNKAKEWRKANEESIKEYRKKNAEKMSAYLKVYKKKYCKENAERLSEYKKQYRKENAEILSKKWKEYYGRTSDKRLSYNKEYVKNNQDKLCAYREKNKEKMSKRLKEYYKKNKHRQVEYRERNRDRLRKWSRGYNKRRKETDVQFKILLALRNRIRVMVRRGSKCGSTVELLGCSVEQLRQHLELNFYNKLNNEEMSWSNYNKNGWVIDHIRPCSSFDMTDPSEQRKCFHWSNLQPLWFKENLSKNDKPYPQWLREKLES